MKALDGTQKDTTENQPLRLSQVKTQLKQDLHTMFGAWTEADHCDKD